MKKFYEIEKPVLLWPDGAPGAKGSAPEDCPKLTAYLPKSKGRRAAIVVCAGGGYSDRCDYEAYPIAQWLAEIGIAAFVLDYRVSPYRHPIPLGDAQRAMRMIRETETWQVDPERVGILGFSAGGHLAASAATIFDEGNSQASDPIERQSSRPNALIACYAVLTFGEYGHQGSMINLLGEDYTEEMRRQLSLENRVTAKTPPSFIWHTADDGSVPVENALLFAQALRRQQVPFALHIYPHGRHGLAMSGERADVASWTDLCEDWLRVIGFLGK